MFTKLATLLAFGVRAFGYLASCILVAFHDAPLSVRVWSFHLVPS